jgi:hypothetical protein
MSHDDATDTRRRPPMQAPAEGDQGRRLSRRAAAPVLAAFGSAVVAIPLRGWSLRPATVRAQAAICESSDAIPVDGAGSPCTIVDRLIPDSLTSAWDDLGPRTVKGLVYHRMYDSLAGSDEYLRTGAPGLEDFGVDNQSGKIWQWNDPFGHPHPDKGVSANRAPWANGVVNNPSGNALAFLDDNGGDPNVVNRDQVSISIAGFPEDPISDACLDAVAALSAYFAASVARQWDAYPTIPGKTYGFVRLHNEFDADKPCPGPVVIQSMPDIIARTEEILQRYLMGESGS